MRRVEVAQKTTTPDREPLPTHVRETPPLPDAYRATLREGLESDTGRELALAAGAVEAIESHVRLMLAWNAAINLSGIREPAAVAREHVLDSLAALPLLRAAGIDELLDLGSGAGYPGLPLAAALPVRRALLVESIAKKARFLSVAVEEMGLGARVEVAAMRSEALALDPVQRGAWQAVVSRAVAGLAELAEMSLPLLAPGGLLIAWKRLPLDDELVQARRAVGRLGGRLVECRPVSLPGLTDHVLAVVEKVAATPESFPRDPAVRRRRPL